MQRISIREVQEWSPRDGRGFSTFKPIERTVSYSNNLAQDVGISTRDGFRYRMGPQLNSRESVAFYIIVEFLIPAAMVEAFLKSSSPISGDDNTEYKVARKQLLMSRENPGVPGGVYSVRYFREITLASILHAGGSLYLHEEDIVLTILDKMQSDAEIPLHPESYEGRLSGHGQDVVNLNKKAGEGTRFIYNIKIVDRSGTIGPRWIRINDNIVRIDPVTKSKHPDGVYVTAPKGQVSALEKHRLQVDQYFTEDDFAKVGLFRTYQEAKNADSDYLSKINDADAKLRLSENALNRAMSEAERLQSELMLADKKMQQAEAEHRRDMEKLVAELALMREKHQNEKKSNFRKNLIDFMKSVPALLTAGIAIVLAIKNYFFTKK